MTSSGLTYILDRDLSGICDYMKYYQGEIEEKLALEEAITIEYVMLLINSDYNPKFYNVKKSGIRKIYY